MEVRICCTFCFIIAKMRLTKTVRKYSVAILLLCCLHHVQEVSAFLTSKVQLSPGTFLTGISKIGYDQFLGVPFARPPVGNLRFRVITNIRELNLISLLIIFPLFYRIQYQPTGGWAIKWRSCQSSTAGNSTLNSLCPSAVPRTVST